MSNDNISGQIDYLAYTNALAKNSPITKTFFALSALVMSASAPTPIIPMIILATNVFLLLVVARVPAGVYFHLLQYPTLALTISCIILALFFGFDKPFVQVTSPWFTWNIYQNGITLAVTTFIRVQGAISSTFFLVLTTSITNVFITLRKAKLPKVLAEISLLIYRYIFVLNDVSSKMSVAQKLRLGHSSIMLRIRSAALLLGNLFIQTLEQGEKTFTAMNARGYDGNIRGLEELPPPNKTAVAGIILFDAALVILILIILNAGVV